MRSGTFSLHFVAAVIRRHRRVIGSRWRALDPGQQAMLVLVYLRKGEPFTDLAGFEISTSTAWRYVEETTTLLSARHQGRARRCVAPKPQVTAV